MAVIDVARHRKRSGKGAAQDSKRRAEVRLAPRSVEKGREGSARGMEGQAISQLQRQSLSSREYIDTSGAHWSVYNIAYRYVRALTFRSSRASSARNIAPSDDPDRSRQMPESS